MAVWCCVSSEACAGIVWFEIRDWMIELSCQENANGMGRLASPSLCNKILSLALAIHYLHQMYIATSTHHFTSVGNGIETKCTTNTSGVDPLIRWLEIQNSRVQDEKWIKKACIK